MSNEVWQETFEEHTTQLLPLKVGVCFGTARSGQGYL